MTLKENYLNEISQLKNERIERVVEAAKLEFFENGIKNLGTLLGYDASNPKGQSEPDTYWRISNQLCIVTEDKIYESDKKPVPPRHLKEASAHEKWIRSKKLVSDDGKVYTLFITNASRIDECGRHIPEDIRYLSRDSLIKWAENAINCIIEVRRTFKEDTTWRENVLELFSERKCTPSDFIELFENCYIKDL